MMMQGEMPLAQYVNIYPNTCTAGGGGEGGPGGKSVEGEAYGGICEAHTEIHTLFLSSS